jgi:hypothetical protein
MGQILIVLGNADVLELVIDEVVPAEVVDPQGYDGQAETDPEAPELASSASTELDFLRHLPSSAQ